MPVSLYQQNSFTSGVLEPKLKGRVDIQQYFQGLQTGDNIMLLPQGGFRQRYGSVFIDEFQSTNVKLFELAIDENRIYLVAFISGVVRIYRDGQFVYELQPSDIIPPASTYGSLTSLVKSAQLENVLILVQQQYAPQRLINKGTDTDWELSIVPFLAVPQFDYNDAASPTPTDDIQTFTFANFNEGDRFQIVIKNITTADIHYSPDSATTAENMELALRDHPVLGIDGIAVTGTLPTLTLTLSDSSADAYDTHIAYATGTVDSSTDNTITVSQTQQGSPRKEDVWSLGRGWPKTVVFYQGRMWFGGTTSKPQSLFASRSGSFFDFDLGEGLDDDAIFITIATRTLNQIRNLVAGRNLQIFTAGGEFSIVADIPTPGNSAVRTETNHGSLLVEPVEIDGSTLFVDDSGKVIREFIFTFQEDSYSAASISVLAQHLIKQPQFMSAQRGTTDDDANYVFIVNEDGTMAIMNTLREQGIRAFTNAETDGEFKQVLVVDDVPYVVVEREINSSTVTYLEQLTFDTVLDSASIQTGSQQTVWTGLDHLEGETVRVIGDGAVLQDAVVASGQITTERPVDDLQVGFWSKPVAQAMPLVGDPGTGPNHLRYRMIKRVSLRVHETDALQFDGVTVPRRKFGDSNNSPLNTPPTPFTGVIEGVESNRGWSLEQAPIVSQEEPGTFTVLSIIYELESR